MDHSASASNSRSLKKGVDQEDARRRRTETVIQVRKEKKEDQLNKRRSMLTSDDIGAQTDAHVFGSIASSATKSTNQQSVISNEIIAENYRDLHSDNPALQLKATQQFRRFLSIERNPPIQQVIEAGVVPAFVIFLQRDDYPALQFEAAWALTNIASGTSDHTRFVIEAGAVPIFVRLLMSPNEDVREQTAWALGNVAGDSVQCRDLVLASGALQALLQVSSSFNDTSRLSTIRNCTWTLSNLCRGKPSPPFEQIRHALPLLSRLLYSQDMETVTDACWALSYMSDGPNERIDAVLSSGVAPRLVELLGHNAASVQTPALRTVGNIVTGDDSQTQFVINLNALPALLALLDHPKKNIRKEACWTISNITAGTADQIQAIVDCGVFPKLIDLLRSSEFDIQKEAAWAVSNATSGGNAEQIMYLVQNNAIPPLCELLQVSDSKVVAVALEGLENIFKLGQTLGEAIMQNLVTIVIDCNGLQLIEDLQNHENQNIYQRAVKVLETYLGAEDEEDGVIIAPEVMSGGQTYGFGGPPGGGPSSSSFQFGGTPSNNFRQ